MTRRLDLLIALAVLVATLGSGCVSTQRYGTARATEKDLVDEGATDGAVISAHGVPDQIIRVYEGPAYGTEGPQVEKLLFVYRIVDAGSFGTFYTYDEFTNVCYFIVNGKVEGRGIARGGSGASILYGDRFFPHPRGRGGHGGDDDPTGGSR